MNYHVAIDIGASSGRHILSWIDDGKLIIEEVYRFKNSAKLVDDVLCWDINYLFNEIILGLKKCKELGKIPTSVAVDTWGVDFVLLDKGENIIGNTVCYRDKRTHGIPEKVAKIISDAELYSISALQKMDFNTIYQLYYLSLNKPHELSKAEHFLMIPDYLTYLLTGKMINEYTIASTTSLLNTNTRDWDTVLLDKLLIPSHIFKKPTMAGTVIGSLKEDIIREIGYDLSVIAAPSHDTASAVLAAPYADEAVYISSGTWSLMGIESDAPILSNTNFTNEGGFNYKYRYLKNIMGLWMIQSVKKELDDIYTFDDLCVLAKQNDDFHSIVDVTDSRFLAPSSMIDEVKSACKDKNQRIPDDIGKVCAVIYKSLAHCYEKTTEEIEEITGKKYDTINIVGGGTSDKYLSMLTAKFSGKKVIAGPKESTAIGNILTQMIAANEISSREEGRSLVKASFHFDVFDT